MTPVAATRFAADLAPLLALGQRLGLAVSGGPDSLAMLLLAHAVRPGEVEVATVDHALRDGSRGESETVAAHCEALQIPHEILTVYWPATPTANLQARARDARYALLADWASDRGLAAVATAHHADDQAETLLMRLNRGAGITGLGGARPSRPLTPTVALIRPLLGWRKGELEAIAAPLSPADDPSNNDPRHDRTAIRTLLREAPLDPTRLAASAAWLREADDALDWALAPLLDIRLVRDGEAITLDPSGLPRELQRRLLLAAFAHFAVPAPRGPDLARAMAALEAGETTTLAQLKLSGGRHWRIAPAPPRRPTA